jgi:hypothetical protein
MSNPKRFNSDRSRELSQKVRAIPHGCYRNAVGSLIWLPDGAFYIEGWLARIIPIEHGWIELGDEIFDPTLPDGDAEYFAGPRYARRVVLRAISRGTLDLPIVYGRGRGLKALRRGFGGLESDEYRHAMEEAQRLLYGGTVAEYMAQLSRLKA